MSASGIRLEREDMRIENKDIIPILDSLTPEEESEGHEQFISTKAAIRAVLQDHIKLDILVSGKNVEIRRDVCERAKKIVESSRREGDPLWDDPQVQEICGQIGVRLAIPIFLGRHPDFPRFLRHVRGEGGMFHLSQFFLKQFKPIHGILYRLMAKFERQGESKDIGRIEIEHFLTRKIREQFAGNMVVRIASGEPGVLHPPRSISLDAGVSWRQTVHRQAVPQEVSQVSEKMRKLAGDIITVTVTPGILALLQFKRGVITQEGDKMRCLVAYFRGRVYLRSMDDKRQFKEHSLTPELEAELVYEVKRIY